MAEADRHEDSETGMKGEADRQAHRPADRPTDGQHMWADGQTDRQTDGQAAGRHTSTCTRGQTSRQPCKETQGLIRGRTDASTDTRWSGQMGKTDKH